jgi:hypothetical protein
MTDYIKNKDDDELVFIMNRYPSSVEGSNALAELHRRKKQQEIKNNEIRDERERETLSIARSAKTIAIIAIVITTILSIVTIIIQLLTIK